MIITQIFGGLGNQMFQYAAGRALALERGQSLQLDISRFSGYGLHQGFELQRVFDCPVRIASEAEVRIILGWQFLPSMQRVLTRSSMSMFRNKRFVVEPHFYFWHALKNVPQDCYLAGYWQSEKYFHDARSVIRSEFTFKLPMGSKNSEVAKQIAHGNAISLHVRRGDYAKDPKTAATHGLCSLDYYRTAIRHISAQVEQPIFYIFSDDIAWVKENLEMHFPHQFVDHNQGAESYNDMRLMSMCKHHIIANSSFSWWGAWLNPSPEKIVIAPKKWFAKQTDTRDLIPHAWVRL